MQSKRHSPTPENTENKPQTEDKQFTLRHLATKRIGSILIQPRSAFGAGAQKPPRSMDLDSSLIGARIIITISPNNNKLIITNL